MTEKPLHEKKISELVDYRQWSDNPVYLADLKEWAISIVKRIREFKKENKFYELIGERDEKIRKWKIECGYNQYVDGYQSNIDKIMTRYDPLLEDARDKSDKILKSLGLERYYEDFDSTDDVLTEFLEKFLMERFEITEVDLK